MCVTPAYGHAGGKGRCEERTMTNGFIYAIWVQQPRSAWRRHAGPGSQNADRMSTRPDTSNGVPSARWISRASPS